MTTYGGAVDYILTNLARSDTSLTVVVEREFQRAVEFYASERFWFNEARTSFTASATIYYPLATIFPATSAYSAGYVEIDQLSINVNGSVYEMQPRTHQELVRIDLSGQTGEPALWAIFGEQFRLYPKCASGTTYQIDVDGTRRLATLSASTDTNAWTNEGLNLISARVEGMLWARKFMDPTRAEIASVVEQQELTKLRERTERYLSTGTLKANW